MSRSRLPPTPSMSGEFIVKDQPAIEGTDVFALPPAAIDASASRRSSKTADHLPASPAASPDFMALGRSTNSRQQPSGTKRPLEDFDLPPPPTRTRKIIQMKPKTQQSPSSKSGTASGGKASKDSGKAAPSSNANAATAPTSGNKKKQPSATSAAGRKIARKTAHSLIERRRRSKMNEEFTTLKDMIPACKGQEMHKLAILQVSFVHSFLSCFSQKLTIQRQALTMSTTWNNALKISRLPGVDKQQCLRVYPRLHHHQHLRNSSQKWLAQQTASVLPLPHQSSSQKILKYLILPRPSRLAPGFVP